MDNSRTPHTHIFNGRIDLIENCYVNGHYPWVRLRLPTAPDRITIFNFIRKFLYI